MLWSLFVQPDRLVLVSRGEEQNLPLAVGDGTESLKPSASNRTNHPTVPSHRGGSCSDKNCKDWTRLHGLLQKPHSLPFPSHTLPLCLHIPTRCIQGPIPCRPGLMLHSQHSETASLRIHVSPCSHNSLPLLLHPWWHLCCPTICFHN